MCDCGYAELEIDSIEGRYIERIQETRAEAKRLIAQVEELLHAAKCLEDNIFHIQRW